MVPKGDLAGTRPTLLRLRAGGCTFHDGLTFHAATSNSTKRPRRAMVTIYMVDGTAFNGKAHLCTDGLGLAVGAPLAGEGFPVLATSQEGAGGVRRGTARSSGAHRGRR